MAFLLGEQRTRDPGRWKVTRRGAERHEFIDGELLVAEGVVFFRVMRDRKLIKLRAIPLDLIAELESAPRS